VILAVCNQKGGVGKTATTFHLTRAAVLSGRKVLAVDLDPQGNLTRALAGEQVAEDAPGLADALSTRTREGLDDVLVPGAWPGVELAPTVGEALGTVRDELVIAGAGREGRLHEALAPVLGRYDLVLVDCPPSLDQLTINGLTAADAVLVVTQSKLFSVDGLDKLLKTVGNVRRYYNPRLRVAGVVVNQHEATTVSGRHWLSQMDQAAHLRDLKILTPPMPKLAPISDSMEAGYGLDQWGSAKAAVLGQTYGAYLEEVLR
jgi:chromosome partitioning protein